MTGFCIQEYIDRLERAISEKVRGKRQASRN